MAEHEQEREENGGRSPSARGVWSGAVTFGLVSIPVALMPAARSGGPHFRMLGPNGTPIARRWVCSKDEKELQDDDIVRGYEVREGRFVVVTDEELEALEPKRSREMEIDRFVPLDDIPPLYFERPYYLAPVGSAKAYAVLARVMEKTKRAAIATFVMHDREHAVVLIGEGGLLRASTMRFVEDVRDPGRMGVGSKKKAEARRVKALQQAIAKLRGTKLDERLLDDEYAARVEAEAKKKRKRGADVVEADGGVEEEEQEVDLTAALREALARSGKRRASASRKRGKHSTRSRGRKGGRKKTAA